MKSLRHSLAPVAALVLASTLAWPSLVHAQSYGVQIHSTLIYTAPAGTAASIYARAGDCIAVACTDALSFETGFLAGVAATSAGGSVSHSGSAGANHGDADVSGRATVAMGAIGAGGLAHLSATLSGDGAQFASHALLGFIASTRDDIVLISGTLPTGAAVDARFTLTLDSSVVQTGAFAGTSGGAWAVLDFNAEGGPNPRLSLSDTTLSGPPLLRTVSTVLHLQVGQHYTMRHSLELAATGLASGAGTPTSENWTLDITADHTARAFVDVLGDATLLAASGHNYVSAVPEPSSVLMWLAGLGCCWRVRARPKWQKWQQGQQGQQGH